jgi:TolB-like protein/Flp pilus assembly protein TadD
LVDEQRKLIRPVLARHNGKEIKTMGDAFLVEFPNALDAVRCAYDIQRATREFNISLPAEKRIRLRVGLHLGDVVESQGDISGDAVNVASRIEPLAEDGGVCVTRQVYENVHNKFEVPLITMGMKPLKNVIEPMEVYRMKMPWMSTEGTLELELDSKRIAVLPFVSMSPDPNDEYFADGMTEELIGKLSQLRELEVIARTSVMAFKKKEKKVSEIARELEVGTIVEGSVRKAGNRIRVTVQLINANTEAHLWASNYDRGMEDIFAIQSEIASKVTESIPTFMVGSGLQPPVRETKDVTAYAYFLRGRQLFHEHSERALRQGAELFQEAINLDSSFARAYVGWADCWLHIGNHGYEPLTESVEKAKAYLTKAIQIDDSLAEAHACLGIALYNLDDFQGAEAESRIAIEYNPNLADAYVTLGVIEELKGEAKGSVRLFEKAYKLDPVSVNAVTSLGDAYFHAGRFEEALDFWNKTLQIAPYWTCMSMATYYIQRGDYEKATELVSKGEKIEPLNPHTIYRKGILAAVKGDEEGARSSIKQLEESRAGATAFSWIGFIRYALGDMDAFFDCINRALESHALAASALMYDPFFERGRADPRYQIFLERMKKMFWPEKE